MSDTVLNRLQFLISNDQMEEVITLLQDGDNWIPENAKKEILLISQQWREVKQQEIRGIISNEKAIFHKKEIRELLIGFVERYFNTSNKNANHQRKTTIIIGVFIFFIVLMILWFFWIK